MLLLMDLDGVLIDCRDAVFVAYRKGFEHVSRWLERSEFEQSMDGLCWPDSAKAVFPSIGDEELATVREVKDACFEEALQTHPGKVDKRACALVRAFREMGSEIWLVTAGSAHATHLKLGALPTDVQEAFGEVVSGLDKTGDAFYAGLRSYRKRQRTMMLVDDDRRVWKVAREKLDGIVVMEWGR